MGSSLLAMEAPQQEAGESRACTRGESAQTDRLGTRMGDYQLTKLIGECETGVVYRGRHVVSDAQVAIKMLHGPCGANEQLVERLLTGARAASAVRHANLIAVLDLGRTPDGTAFVVTEHLTGESLEARLRRVGRLPPFEAINILRQLAQGLGAAHEAGLVHGGLRPSHVFLCKRKGRRRLVRHSGHTPMHLAVEPEDSFDLVKLLDLGIAGALDVPTEAVPPGTPSYRSPEQVDGKPAERGSDIYALGAIFYEVLTGAVPAHGPGKDAAGVLTLASRRVVDAGIDARIDDLILRCLKRTPRLRFPSTAAVRAALDACVTDCAFLREAFPARLLKTARVVAPKRPPPIPRAEKATAAMRNPPGQLIPLPPAARHSRARHTPPPIPLTSDLLTELSER